MSRSARRLVPALIALAVLAASCAPKPAAVTPVPARPLVLGMHAIRAGTRRRALRLMTGPPRGMDANENNPGARDWQALGGDMDRGNVSPFFLLANGEPNLLE